MYIAPLKALVRERVNDWNSRICGPMKRKLVELTGDVTPDLRTIQDADIIISTPEKWDVREPIITIRRDSGIDPYFLVRV